MSIAHIIKHYTNVLFTYLLSALDWSDEVSLNLLIRVWSDVWFDCLFAGRVTGQESRGRELLLRRLGKNGSPARGIQRCGSKSCLDYYILSCLTSRCLCDETC